MDNAKGFSLIELIIIILIIAVLAVTLVPRLKESTEFRLPITARKVTQDIRYARQKGMDTRVTYGVYFSAAPNIYWVYRSVSGTRAEDPLTRQDYDVNLNADEYTGVTISSVDFGGYDSVEFDAFGTPSSGGTVVLSDGSNTRTISVEAATGMVSY